MTTRRGHFGFRPISTTRHRPMLAVEVDVERTGAELGLEAAGALS
jgi:hypothetical protein